MWRLWGAVRTDNPCCISEFYLWWKLTVVYEQQNGRALLVRVSDSVSAPTSGIFSLCCTAGWSSGSRHYHYPTEAHSALLEQIKTPLYNNLSLLGTLTSWWLMKIEHRKTVHVFHRVSGPFKTRSKVTKSCENFGPGWLVVPAGALQTCPVDGTARMTVAQVKQDKVMQRSNF